MIPFKKYQGCGNDFLVIDFLPETHDVGDVRTFVQSISNRHFGVGADGVIFARQSHCADYRMELFNADGSEPEMCGNGVRCLVQFLLDEGYLKADSVSIETASGIKVCKIIEGRKGTMISVNMGAPILESEKIVTTLGHVGHSVIKETLEIENESYAITAVSMGNPHAVIFVPNVDHIVLSEKGPKFEFHPVFPQGTNTEFAQVRSRQLVKVKVWERGAGETLACGTGACATVVAGVLADVLNRQCVVALPGGDLEILWDPESDDVHMTGPAAFVFSGTF